MIMAKSSPIILLSLAACLGIALVPIFPIASVFSSEAQAQTEADRKTEAERLLNLCREHLGKEQLEAAVESCQQAVTATLF